MAYFNHAFSKMFLGTHASQASVPGVTAGVDEGFLLDDGLQTIDLNDTAAPFGLGIGTYGFFAKDSQLSVDLAYITANSCCPLVLVGASVLTKDKIGPFAGGYSETNKSKLINPRYITRFYRVDPCLPNQEVLHIGNTPYTDSGIASFTLTAPGVGYTDGVYTNVPLLGGTGTGATADITIVAGVITVIDIVNSGINYTAADALAPDTTVVGVPGVPAVITVDTVYTAGDATCCKEFICNESYTLRIDVKGSPELRYLSRNGYWSVAKWTGCCVDPIAPAPVDSTEVFIDWAQQIIENKIIGPFMQVIVYDQTGGAWYAPGTGGGVNTWDNYVSPGFLVGSCAGMTLIGAYVDTKFGDCTFYPSDFFEKEPVKILASLVDETGDVCEFETLCVIEECAPRQGMGFGEQVLRDLIMSESYRQNYFATNQDLRIREVTLGYDISSAVNRNAFYYRYYIQHNVPRFNNPTGVFDNDQYMLEIVTEAPSAALEAFVNQWVGDCNGPCSGLEVITCGAACPVPVV